MSMGNKNKKYYFYSIVNYNGIAVPVFTARPKIKMAFAVDSEKAEKIKRWCHLNSSWMWYAAEGIRIRAHNTDDSPITKRRRDTIYKLLRALRHCIGRHCIGRVDHEN